MCKGKSVFPAPFFKGDRVDRFFKDLEREQNQTGR